MENGEIGLHGVLVRLLVAVVIKLEPVSAITLRHRAVVSIAQMMAQLIVRSQVVIQYLAVSLYNCLV